MLEKKTEPYDVYFIKDVKNAVLETNKVVEKIMNYITQSKSSV